PAVPGVYGLSFVLVALSELVANENYVVSVFEVVAELLDELVDRWLLSSALVGLTAVVLCLSLDPRYISRARLAMACLRLPCLISSRARSLRYRSFLSRELIREAAQVSSTPNISAGSVPVLDAQQHAASDIEWRRPTELVSNPHLVVDGVSGSDVMQGERGNAWFVTASAALTSRPGQLNSVLPNWTQQDYGDDFHPGIFRFLFSRHGGLYEVVIDDLLPTRKGRLVYAHSCEENEFWSALLEKAYAKVTTSSTSEHYILNTPQCNRMHGDYASLSRGRVVDALASFVRGIPEHWDLRQMRQPGAENGINPDSPDDQAQLAKQFYTHLSRRSLILFSLQTKLKDGKTPVTLMMFQNAWFDMEWTGAWSDGSPEWRSVTLEFKDKIGLVDSKDGIFWMSIGDVLKQFTDVDICVVTGVGSIRSWLIYTFHNEWTAEQVGRGGRRRSVDYSAGGSYEYKDTYASNPQYLLTIPGENPNNVSFYLEQGDPQSEKSHQSCAREAWLALRVKPERQPGVLMKARFEPGNYLMMPCTKEPGQQQNFTLRAFSQDDYSMTLLPDLVPQPTGTCSCCEWNLFGVTRLIVTKVKGVNSYLRTQGKVVSACSPVSGLTAKPQTWVNAQSGFVYEDKKEKDTFYVDFKVLLYRHQLLDPIDIEVYSQSAISFTKKFVGTAAIIDKDCVEDTPKEALLSRNGKQVPVKLYCTVQSARDIDFF
uniref:Calpain catalytic domain-containing protein n=1 Tax=Macrostomum lignano TaxID=282301 RepID=A0A1I8JS83_9PLAT